MLKAAVLIEGGHLRVLARKAKHVYEPDFIERFARACVDCSHERLLRVLYYDCDPWAGKARLPVSGQMRQFSASGEWLNELARRERFAVRRGVLKFRGFKPRHVPISPQRLSDADFKPDFEQKGVDMRIGLDIATLSASRSVDRIILVTNDTDCIPAMKHGRMAGIQVVLVRTPEQQVARELLYHADFHREVPGPAGRLAT